jgi:MFS family permease
VLTAQSGITLYLPSLPSIAEHFHAQPNFQALTLSAFLAGMGLPMLLWGKVAARWGSRKTLLCALCLFGGSSLFVAVSSDTSMFLTGRAIQGAAAGGISVMARVLIRDAFTGKRLAQALSWLSICFVISLGLAQFVGAVLHAAWGWNAIFVTSATLSFLLVLPVRIYVPERANAEPAPRPIRKIYVTLFQDMRFMRPVLAGGLGYGVVIIFGACAPAIFQQKFDWSVVEYGLIGWPISCAYLVGALSVSWLISTRSQEESLRLGLKFLAAGAVLMSAGPLLFPETANSLLLPYCILLAGQGIVYPLCQALANQNAKISGPYAMALTGFIHQAIAACCSLLASVLPPGQTGPFTVACITLALAALAIGLREKTKEQASKTA